MCRMVKVSPDGMCSETRIFVGIFNSWKSGFSNALSNFHHLLQHLTVRQSAGVLSDRDAISEDALDGTMVEVHQGIRGRVVIPQCLQKEELLVNLLCPGWSSWWSTKKC
ncbi:hypothetical protein GOODEAATRI_012649 [Goodea atripinnis]|uniref:Uncharacterized protein n=1 Tax=Goodea atripinnis TaxID=208336 RepID=A0ABV0PXG4_9TELE